MPKGSEWSALDHIDNLDGDGPGDAHGSEDVAAEHDDLCWEDAVVKGQDGELDC